MASGPGATTADSLKGILVLMCKDVDSVLDYEKIIAGRGVIFIEPRGGPFPCDQYVCSIRILRRAVLWIDCRISGSSIVCRVRGESE